MIFQDLTLKNITSLHPFRYDGGEEDTFLTGGILFSLDRCLLMGDPIIHLFTSYST